MKLISLKEFILKYKGSAVDVPWGHLGECVSLVQRYVNECHGLPLYRKNGSVYARGHAKNFGYNLIADGDATFVNAPKYGDIVVWGKDVAKGYGHVSIYIDDKNDFDQNRSKDRTAKTRTRLAVKPIAYVRMKTKLVPDKVLKPLDEIAKDVRAGKYKDFPERKKLLEYEGYNYKEVQDRVNELIEQDKKEVVYIVKRGDTLSGIASKNGTTYQKIAKDNNIKKPDLILPGQKLIIK